MTTVHSVQTAEGTICRVKIEFCIKEFVSLLELGGDSELKLCSEIVVSPVLPTAVWQLEVYPNDEGEGSSKGYCGFFITLTGSMGINNETIDALSQIYLIDGGSAAAVGSQKSSKVVMVVEKTKQRFVAWGSGWGGDMANHLVKKLLREDGSLLVVAEVEVLTPSRSTTAAVEFAFDEGALKEEHLAMMGALLERGLGSDCSLLVGEKNFVFRVHKALLSASSPSFAEMLGENKGGEEGIVVIEQFQPEPVKAMLEYIYKGAINWDHYGEDETERWAVQADLLSLSHKYALLGLKTHMECRLAASTIATPAQLVEMARLADQLVCTTLKKRCVDHLRAHRSSIIATSEWKALKSGSPNLTTELLELAG